MFLRLLEACEEFPREGSDRRLLERVEGVRGQLLGLVRRHEEALARQQDEVLEGGTVGGGALLADRRVSGRARSYRHILADDLARLVLAELEALGGDRLELLDREPREQVALALLLLGEARKVHLADREAEHLEECRAVAVRAAVGEARGAAVRAGRHC